MTYERAKEILKSCNGIGVQYPFAALFAEAACVVAKHDAPLVVSGMKEIIAQKKAQRQS